MIKKGGLFLAIVLLSGCSYVHFDNAMPIESIKIKSFNNHLIGRYYLSDSLLKVKNSVYKNGRYFNGLDTVKDSLSLIFADVSITQKKVYYSGNLKFYYNINKVDTLVIISHHKKERKFYENNFVVFEGDFSDTLIDLNKKDEIKLYKGKYYLNHFVGEYDWDIYQVGLRKDSLLSISITNQKDEKWLSDYLINRNKILGNTVHVSDDEFYHFVENGGFRNRYKFKKY